MTDAAANDSLSFWGPMSPNPPTASLLFTSAWSVASLTLASSICPIRSRWWWLHFLHLWPTGRAPVLLLEPRGTPCLVGQLRRVPAAFNVCDVNIKWQLVKNKQNSLSEWNYFGVIIKQTCHEEKRKLVFYTTGPENAFWFIYFLNITTHNLCVTVYYHLHNCWNTKNQFIIRYPIISIFILY